MAALNFPGRLSALYRTLAIKIILIAVIFLVVPIIQYRLFQIGDAQQSELLQSAVQQQANLITVFLRRHLENFTSEPPDALQTALDEVVSQGSSIKVLVRPQSGNASQDFLYVASAPAVSSDYLRNERDALIKLGVFDKLAPSCDGEISPTVQFTNPAGKAEVLTSMRSLHLGADCWVIITTQATQAFLGSAIGQPIWRSPSVNIAAIVYLSSALLVAWLFLDIWRNLRRFRTVARTIRLEGAGGPSFREMNTIPELTGVADDFDSLVAALKQSKDFIVQAAEENAHALKAPLAVISQAIEPLKRAVLPSNPNALRSLELIERSTARLDLLVSAARDIEQAGLEAIYPNLRRINLSACLAQLISAFQSTLVLDGKKLQFSAEPNVHILGAEEAIEAAVENLLENAASFTPAGGSVEVSLSVSDGVASLEVADDGPGVREEDLPRIFERHFSARAPGAGQHHASGDRHYGLGLWIAWRNVEGMGGTLEARNRDTGGFLVAVRFTAVA
jgi:two-component system sensor histidine kinase ChvG